MGVRRTTVSLTEKDVAELINALMLVVQTEKVERGIPTDRDARSSLEYAKRQNRLRMLLHRLSRLSYDEQAEA